jgi:hypothetical protein
MKCEYFNPMYLYTRCKKCDKFASTICADCNYCNKCHKPMGLIFKFKVWLLKKAYQD